MQEPIFFNGWNATQKGYQNSAMTIAELQNQIDDFQQPVLSKASHLGLKYKPHRLDSVGWGLIVPDDMDEVILKQLDPLIEKRRQQAGFLFKILTCYVGEPLHEFFDRYGVCPGHIRPERVPFYLMILADPIEISFDFQHQLEADYAVGRLHFENVIDYATYSKSVLKHEDGPSIAKPKAAFASIRLKNDPLTVLSQNYLVDPLIQKIKAAAKDWQVESVPETHTNKHQLLSYFGGSRTPNFLFTAGHGLVFDQDDPRFVKQQGGIVCSNLPHVRTHQGQLDESDFLTACDLGDDCDLTGLVSFHFGCYSVGTPQFEVFRQAGRKPRNVAPHPMLAALPQRMLSIPSGSALAVIGHVGLAWEYAFIWDKKQRVLGYFAAAIAEMLDGFPLGLAMKHFQARFASLTADLFTRHRRLGLSGMDIMPKLSPWHWVALQDARAYALFGDPAVCLKAGGSPE